MFRVQDLGFRVEGSGFDLGFRVEGSGFGFHSPFSATRTHAHRGIEGLGFRIQGSGFRVQGRELRVQGSGFAVSGLGSGVSFSSTLRLTHTPSRAWG